MPQRNHARKEHAINPPFARHLANHSTVEAEALQEPALNRDRVFSYRDGNPPDPCNDIILS